MDQETIQKIKKQLEDRKSELLRLIKEQQEEMGAIQATRSPDWLDLTTATPEEHCEEGGSPSRALDGSPAQRKRFAQEGLQ